MIILPFKPVSPITEQSFCGAFTDIHYAPELQITGGKVTISRKFLIKDFTSKTSPTFIKMLYVFKTDSYEEIYSIEDLKAYNPILDLKYIIVTGADDVPSHSFGITVYCKNNYMQNKFFIYDSLMDQVLSEQYLKQGKAYQYSSVVRSYNNAMFILIKNENPMEFIIATGDQRNSVVSENERFHDTYTVGDFIDGTPCKFHSYRQNILEKMNYFSENNLLDVSKSLFVTDNVPEIISNSVINDLIVKKDILDDFLSTMIKPNIISLFDSITLTYDSKKGIIFRNFTNPFGRKLVPWMYKGFDAFKFSVDEAAMYGISEFFGDTTINIHVNDIYHFAHCKIKVDDESEEFYRMHPENAMIKDIVMKDEAIFRYLSEEIYGAEYRYKFQDHLLRGVNRTNDLLNYFNDGERENYEITFKE